MAAGPPCQSPWLSVAAIDVRCDEACSLVAESHAGRGCQSFTEYWVRLSQMSVGHWQSCRTVMSVMSLW